MAEASRCYENGAVKQSQMNSFRYRTGVLVGVADSAAGGDNICSFANTAGTCALRCTSGSQTQKTLSRHSRLLL